MSNLGIDSRSKNDNLTQIPAKSCSAMRNENPTFFRTAVYNEKSAHTDLPGQNVSIDSSDSRLPSYQYHGNSNLAHAVLEKPENHVQNLPEPKLNFAWKDESRWIKRQPKHEFQHLFEATEGLGLDIYTKLIHGSIVGITGLKTIFEFDSQIIDGQIYSAFQIFKRNSTLIVSPRFSFENLDYGVTSQAFQDEHPNNSEEPDFHATEASYFGQKFKVHNGYHRMARFIVDKLFELKNQGLIKNTERIYFTGFSLGGSISSLACAELENRLFLDESDNDEHFEFYPEVRSLAFASPGVSDEKLSKILKRYCVTFWLKADPCPRLFMYDKRHTDVVWVTDKRGGTYRSLQTKTFNKFRDNMSNFMTSTFQILTDITGNNYFAKFIPMLDNWRDKYKPILYQLWAVSKKQSGCSKFYFDTEVAIHEITDSVSLQKFFENELAKQFLENCKTKHMFYPSGNLFWNDSGSLKSVHSELDTETFQKHCAEIGRWDNDFSSHNPFVYKKEVDKIISDINKK